MVRTSPGVTCLHVPPDPVEGDLPQWYVPPQVLHAHVLHAPGVTTFMYPPTPWKEISPDGTYLPRCYMPQVLHAPGVTCALYPRPCGRRSPQWYIPPQVLHTWCYISQVLQAFMYPPTPWKEISPDGTYLPRCYIPGVTYPRCYSLHVPPDSMEGNLP